MDRFVILVDAGYLYAAAGDLCHGTSSRRDLQLDPTRVITALVDVCEKHCGMKYLRTYWYDGAIDAVPTPQQNALADQRGVKLRLGRMMHGGQKGVDSRIVRDLIVLPRSGAVGTIFLLSGDEDVREGMVEAQELGVSVVLLGIEAPPGTHTQAKTLVREADDHVILPRAECERFLSDARISSTASAGASVLTSATSQLTPAAISSADAEAFGAHVAAAWKSGNDTTALAALIAVKPKIPISIDGPLLRSATSHFGVALSESDRRAIRSGFWKEIES